MTQGPESDKLILAWGWWNLAVVACAIAAAIGLVCMLVSDEPSSVAGWGGVTFFAVLAQLVVGLWPRKESP